MEPHLEMVVKVLLHRTGGANSFLREACEEALRQMVLHVNPHKSLVSLVTGGVRFVFLWQCLHTYVCTYVIAGQYVQCVYFCIVIKMPPFDEQQHSSSVRGWD